MTKPELLALFRTLADDAVAPYLCSDAQANLWISEAEREACERALFLRTGATHNITVISGTAAYTMHTGIIFIDRAKLSSETKPLVKTTRAELDLSVHDWENVTGTPKYYFIENRTITLYPKPDAGFTLNLDGSRRAASDMEIPANWHEALVYWVLYRFYSGRDADILNNSAAELNLRRFGAVFGHKRSAAFDVAWHNAGYSAAFAASQF
jgi:hypothetical protein